MIIKKIKKTILIITVLITVLIIPSFLLVIERAPRISDREIAERLTRLEEGQKNLEKRFDDFRSEMNGRFDTLQWMLGLFITIVLVILGFVLRMQWQMQRRQTRMETTLETHKDELAFLKSLIEKLLPPKSAL